MEPFFPFNGWFAWILKLKKMGLFVSGGAVSVLVDCSRCWKMVLSLIVLCCAGDLFLLLGHQLAQMQHVLFTLMCSWKQSFKRAISVTGIGFQLWKWGRQPWFALQSNTGLHAGLLRKPRFLRDLAGDPLGGTQPEAHRLHVSSSSSARKPLLHLGRPTGQWQCSKRPGFPLGSRLPWSHKAVLKRNNPHPTWEKFPVVKSLRGYFS